MTQARQPQCIQNPERIDAGAIRAAIANDQNVLVQFNALGEPEPLLADLDALAATCGTALTIRIYGYDPRVFDARILRALPHVASLSIDCHRQAIHLEALGELRHELGLRLKLTHAQRDTLAADASGDSLDAVLCLLQAAWAQRQGAPRYGLPQDMDPLEGWILTA